MRKFKFLTLLFLLVFGFSTAQTGAKSILERNKKVLQDQEVVTQQQEEKEEDLGYPYYPVSDKQLAEYIGKTYKKFRGITEDGKVVNIKDLIDGKPALLIFFAIGDKPGTFDFLPHMNELYEKYKNKVAFVAVLLSRSDKEEVQELKKLLPLKIPVLRAYGEAISRYKITKLDVPYMVFIDKNGKVRHIILRPESEMIKESPKVDHPEYKGKSQEERISMSMKTIEKYIKEIIKE